MTMPPPLDIVKACVVGIDDKEVIVDIGEKFESRIPVSDWTGGEELPQVGDVLDVLIDDENDVDDRPTRVQRIHVVKEFSIRPPGIPEFVPGQIFVGRIHRRIESGFLIDIGVNVFLPNGDASVDMLRDSSAFIGRQVTCKITRIDLEKNIVHVALVDEMVKL